MENLIATSENGGTRSVAPPKSGTVADAFHRAAVAAAHAANSETTPLRQLSLLAEISMQSAMCRDLMTARIPGRVSGNEVFVYQLDGVCSSRDVRGALLAIGAAHREMEQKFIGAGRDPSHAAHRAEVMELWASMLDEDPRDEPAAQSLLWATLASNLIAFIARTGPDLIPVVMWLNAESVILAQRTMLGCVSPSSLVTL